MSVKYKGKSWAIMTQETTTSCDSAGLPQFEKVTLTIVRKVSESERKKSHQDSIKRGGGFPLKYSELKKLV
jgi:hypothetical protein